ncbi:MAG: hypothetical protein O2894_11570, partial [Planctomycetota bacterium]|nr:hypothetical protein [Planctomycetota bacterium]
MLRRPAVIAALLLLCAGAPARAGEDLPFVGLGPLDPQSAHDLDAGALEQLAGAGTTLACTTLARTMLARTMPVAWGAIEPAAPIGAEPVYAWPVLDRAVLLWQLAGLDPVLVLSPASPWASLPVADAPLVERVRKVLPAVEAEAALQDLTGAAPPRADRWGAWERFVRAVVERYDFDGADDMPGLRRAVRYVQPLAGIDGAAWLGDEAATVRVLH